MNNCIQKNDLMMSTKNKYMLYIKKKDMLSNHMKNCYEPPGAYPDKTRTHSDASKRKTKTLLMMRLSIMNMPVLPYKFQMLPRRMIREA